VKAEGGTDYRDLGERLLAYGAMIVKIVEALPATLVGRRIGDELLRSGTSPGAHYEEARGAESRADFVHKLQIALKELRESNYWLRLLARAEVLPSARLAPAIDESHQLRSILSKAVASAKGKAKNADGRNGGKTIAGRVEMESTQV
jgi:four helix bundle protein